MNHGLGWLPLICCVGFDSSEKKIAYILVKIETNMKGAEAAAATATLQHILSEDFYDDNMCGVSYYHHILTS